MDKHDVDWKGYWPASPTPFTKEGEFDEASFRSLLRFYVQEGMHGILVNGSTGEWFSQSPQERRRVAEVAVEELKGKVPVVIGCTAFTAAHAIELGEHAKSIGADGILSTPPPYARPQPDEIVNYYRMISDAVDLPLMVYNIPAAVVVSTTPAVALRLADLERVVAIKNTVDDPEFFETLSLVGDRLRIFGGNFLSPIGMAAMRSIGGDGFIAGGMLLGSEGPEFFNSFWKGDFKRAGELAAKDRAVGRLLRLPDGTPRFGRASQSQHKAAQKILGQTGGYPRLPLLPLDNPAHLEELREGLSKIGVKQAAAVA
jgi:1-pyrroline-4-hydroxy-2-carboxylate deaminase